MMPSGGPMTLAPGAGLPRSRKADVGIDGGSEVPQEARGDAVRVPREHEVPELRRFDGERRAAGPGLTQPLVRREEEQLVANDWPAEAVPELVLAELGHRRLERVSRGEAVVLEVVRAAAAELIRSGFGDHLNLRAGIAAVHRGEVVRHDPDLLDRFRVRREVRDAAARDAVRARVVDGERVRFVTLAARVDPGRGLTRERVVCPTAAADRSGYALPRHARLQRNQVVEVPPAQRQFLELQSIDASRHTALLCFHQRRAGRDRQVLLHARDIQRDVHAHGFADADVDRIALGVHETWL